MNRKQKVALWVGVLVFVVSAMVPPWRRQVAPGLHEFSRYGIMWSRQRPEVIREFQVDCAEVRQAQADLKREIEAGLKQIREGQQLVRERILPPSVLEVSNAAYQASVDRERMLREHTYACRTPVPVRTVSIPCEDEQSSEEARRIFGDTLRVRVRQLNVFAAASLCGTVAPQQRGEQEIDGLRLLVQLASVAIITLAAVVTLASTKAATPQQSGPLQP